MNYRSDQILLIVLILSFATSALSQKDPLEGDTDLPNYVRLSDQIAFGGHPTEEGLKKVKEAGFKTVIQYRSPDKASTTEKQTVEGLEMSYAYIPYNGVDDALVESFSKAISDPTNKPIFIHCGKANIVTALWYVHRVLEDGIPEDEAFAEAKKLGLDDKTKVEVSAKKYLSEKTSQ